MCGDFDNRPTYDRCGPQGCLYNNTQDELYQYSWTIPQGKSCNEETLKQKKIEVGEFQEVCTKRPGYEFIKFGKPFFNSNYGILGMSNCVVYIL